MSLQLFKRSSVPFFVPTFKIDLDERDSFSRIRCPLCAWTPTPSSVWSCRGNGTPEPFFGCGTVWNTFATKGKCPGCTHQWTWTSCLRCAGWSLHRDWYESDGNRP